MAKTIWILIVSILICFMMGCSSESAADNTVAKISETVQPVENTDNPVADSSDDYVYPAAYIYTTENNIYSMVDTVTIDGITYQVLECEMTKEFGQRNLKHLNYFYNDNGVDENGNLVNDSNYVFITLQYTNTKDVAVEIIRGDKGIYSVNEHMIVDAYNVSNVYIDPYWDGGTEGQIHHYELGPGETLTSEIGWVIDSSMLIPDSSLYYVPSHRDVETDKGGRTDPDAVFIKLDF